MSEADVLEKAEQEQVTPARHIEIDVNLRHLIALLVIAPKIDIRYYLNGVLLSVKDGKQRLVATDGHRLAMFQIPSASASVPALNIIIPRAAVEVASKAKPSFVPELARIEIDGDRHTLFWNQDSGVVFRPVEGKFPVIDKIIPEKTSGEPSNFNWRYISDFAKLAEAAAGGKLGANSVLLHQNGLGPAIVKIPEVEEFTGVVMPVRT